MLKNILRQWNVTLVLVVKPKLLQITDGIAGHFPGQSQHALHKNGNHLLLQKYSPLFWWLEAFRSGTFFGLKFFRPAVLLGLGFLIGLIAIWTEDRDDGRWILLSLIRTWFHILAGINFFFE